MITVNTVCCFSKCAHLWRKYSVPPPLNFPYSVDSTTTVEVLYTTPLASLILCWGRKQYESTQRLTNVDDATTMEVIQLFRKCAASHIYLRCNQLGVLYTISLPHLIFWWWYNHCRSISALISVDDTITMEVYVLNPCHLSCWVDDLAAMEVFHHHTTTYLLLTMQSARKAYNTSLPALMLLVIQPLWKYTTSLPPLILKKSKIFNFPVRTSKILESVTFSRRKN